MSEREKERKKGIREREKERHERGGQGGGREDVFATKGRREEGVYAWVCTHACVEEFKAVEGI